MIACTPAEAREYRGQDGAVVRDFFGSGTRLERGPQAFSVQHGPDRTGRPHYHAVDQCQVAVRGTAKIGTRPFDATTIFYTDAYVPYGPIACGPSGMTFFNFRPRADVGSHFMPDSRSELPERTRPGRHIIEPTRLAWGAPDRSMAIQSLIPPHEDGLQVHELIASPGVALVPETVGGSGRYQLVLGGSLILDGRPLGTDSCVWARAGEILIRRLAGPEGLHLLEVQLPTA